MLIVVAVVVAFIALPDRGPTTPAPGPHASTQSTVTTEANPTETTAATGTNAAAPTTIDDAMATYREDLQKWWAKWIPKVDEQSTALENFDPLTVTHDQIKAVGKFSSVVNDAAKAFRDIKPPASAASAHADYAAMLQGISNGLERLQKALDAGELSGLIEAYGALEAVLKDSDGLPALEQAAGVKLEDAATNSQTGSTASTAAQSPDVGSKDKPVPLGTVQQVGDWAVTVVKYTPDATAAVLKENQFNDKPPAGETYVLVAVTAKYTGKESGTFWVDLSTTYLGKSGNTFDSTTGIAVAPKPISDAGEAFPGASVSGNLLFQVPTDQATGGLLIAEPTFSFADDERAFFALQ